MRILLVALVLSAQVHAGELAEPVRPLSTASWNHVVAQTRYPNPNAISLLTETCGWPGGAMRAQWVQRSRVIVWGCWGYNETGVQIAWNTGQQVFVDFYELSYWDGAWDRGLNYATLHRRVLFLRNK